ncbi:DUF4235 domain-containing protein [Streptoalloteichus tenebrarius]|uniref:DUF4235 domain-containing protein n=1 Tax=Streptoalloteichus tenebrarius (strain ATCC 17920 / DSM 40477 / JCM 4838 / CBS 697.72 / NBRC 16177 / NCIMB 11028 / NRRL B-12390 / A12253. 1 / ISP 5477) TaxID=1933 RepID=UPI0027E30D18|nr:DUF4235 domain-containing protein [Streptoalloteichus tenebrarius]
MYKPLGVLLGVLGGLAGDAVFAQVWKRVAGRGEAPRATARRATWGQVLASAAIQGAIFGLVKAAIDRGGAAAFHRLTGTWPDD